MERCHRPPPGVAPRPCPAPAAPALLFVSLRTSAAAQLVASENPAQVCREPGSRVPQTPPGADAGKRPEVAWEPWLPRRGVGPGSRLHTRVPAPSLTNVSILIVVLLQLHVQQDVPSHHLHVSPRPSLGCSRLRSAPLGSGRKLRSALSALPRLRSARALSQQALLSLRLSMLRGTPPLPPQIKPPRL